MHGSGTCPEIYLLWCHRCGWEHRTKSGRTQRDALCEKYDQGAAEAEDHILRYFQGFSKRPIRD